MSGMKQWRRMVIVAGLTLLALAGATAARAAVILPDTHTLYLSSPGTGTVAGVAYSDEDVLRYSPAQTPKWAMHFDGSAAGLPGAADIDAYDFEYNANTFTSWHYMSFDQPVTVPGLGAVDDSDIVVYKTTLLSSNWSLYFDGSAYGLATDGEDIDSLGVTDEGTLYLSTLGGFNVPAAGNTFLKGADEDFLMWSHDSQAFVWRFVGSDMGIPAKNDLVNLAYPDLEDGRNISLTSHMLFSIRATAKVQGVSAGAFDVLLRQTTPVSDDFGMFLDASASGFPKIDAVDALFSFD